ncbi:MAG: spermidine synthase [Alphaproteobacteria bacterium]
MTAEDTAGPLPSVRQSQTLFLFAGTLFVSAACMFMVQPMVGKMLLPLVGGTPAGWIVAMAFFQMMLLAGYAAAYALSRFSPRTHGLAFLGLLLLGSLFLPVGLPQSAEGTINAWLVFRLLSVSVGIPFIAISATSSTVQRLFGATSHADAQDPYFLYAASNLGSFTGLLIYPFIVESYLTVPEQSHLWMYAYALLILLSAACLFGPARKEYVPRADKIAPIPGKRKLHWIALAFFPSSLMLGVTTHIITDLISAPMVWVLPLGLYLLTFVVAFSRKPIIPFSLVQKIQPTAVALGIALIVLVNGFMPTSFVAMGIHLFAFTVVSLVCHMRLAQLRPLDDERQLPEFYMMIALGGALGGIMNAFIAPLVFDRMAEYPLVLLASCAINPLIGSPFSFRYSAPFLLGGVIMMLMAIMPENALDMPALRNALLVIVFGLVTFHPRATIVAGAIIYIVAQFTFGAEIKLMARNFYGVIKVYDRDAFVPGQKYQLRVFRHGTTTHSTQILDKNLETIPTAYFSMLGPLGDVFQTFKPEKVAVTGLGAGTLACYSNPKSEFTFVELDPAVVEMAVTQFSFLERCQGARPNRIIIGDGRLELAKLTGEKFDMIILDAFSSDMVPVHLISQEAIKLYLDHLAPGGALVFNLSSRYVRLESTLSAGAVAAGLDYRYWIDERVSSPFLLPSSWLVMARPGSGLDRLADKAWRKADLPPGIRPWTDSYSNVASVIRF